MQRALTDTGPLIAWFNSDDPDHERVSKFFREYAGLLLTTWPVMTEACHLLPKHAVVSFVRAIADGFAQIQEMPQSAAASLASTMEKYADRPMDLADASLVWLAAQTGVHDVVTLDRTDFAIYRLPDGKRLRNLLRD